MVSDATGRLAEAAARRRGLGRLVPCVRVGIGLLGWQV